MIKERTRTRRRHTLESRERNLLPKSAFFRSDKRAIDAIENIDDIPAGYLQGNALSDAAYRAIESGAAPPIEFIGMGATGIVFCDAENAYKVARHKVAARALFDEAQWLATANELPEVAPYVASLVEWNGEHGVIVRECVRGERGTWGGSRKIHELWDRIAPYMLAEGWTMPELKEDSVVFVNGSPKIVDAGMASRVSNRLLAYIENTLDGAIDPDDRETIHDFAFYVRREFGMKPPMDEARAQRLLERLYALGARRD